MAAKLVAKSNQAQAATELSSGTVDVGLLCRCGNSDLLKSRDFVAFLLQHAWIPVEQELPVANKRVLIKTTRGDIEIGKYSPLSGWWILSTRNHVTIKPPSHWMSLP